MLFSFDCKGIRSNNQQHPTLWSMLLYDSICVITDTVLCLVESLPVSLFAIFPALCGHQIRKHRRESDIWGNHVTDGHRHRSIQITA